MHYQGPIDSQRFTKTFTNRDKLLEGLIFSYVPSKEVFKGMKTAVEVLHKKLSLSTNLAKTRHLQ